MSSVLLSTSRSRIGATRVFIYGATRVFIYDPATKTTDSRSTFLPCDIRTEGRTHAQKRRRNAQSEELLYDDAAMLGVRFSAIIFFDDQEEKNRKGPDMRCCRLIEEMAACKDFLNREEG